MPKTAGSSCTIRAKRAAATSSRRRSTEPCDCERTRLYNYVAAIQSYVLSHCPKAIFELLWPMDVNDPDNCRLLRYINLPSQWMARTGSGFDTFLIEGYQYPGINHNLDQATRCAQYPWKELAWDQAHCR